jgi:hypothetical protein
VVSGDFNGDGAPDLVSGHRLDAILTFHLGQASMTLGPQTTTVIGLFGMSDLAAGDFNGDLHLDVVVTSNITHEVHWFLGDGAGNFSPAGFQPVGNFPVSVAVGDLNGDPWPDLAVANALSDDLAVLLNQGGAGFSPPSFWAAGDVPRSVVIGETNGDGNADLAVVNRDTDDVTIRYGDGGGGFATSRAVLGYNAPELVLLVDADRNGALDLVVANKSSLGAEGSLTILPGDGLGDFGPVQVSQAIDPRSVASGDFDRDGRPDLVTLDLSSTEMSFLKGQGDGTFSPATLWPAGLSPPRGIGVGDFDRNGTLDVVLGTNGINLVFLPGDGAGAFGGPGFVSSIDSGTSRRRIGVGDFDRDGALDFVRVSSGNTVVLTYGNGDGTFAFPDRATAVGGSPYDLVVLDFNRDGVLDVAVSNFGSNTVMLLQGTATLAIPRPVTPLVVSESLPAQSPAGIEAGDFDHDGFTDLVVAQFLSVPGKVAYFRGRPQPSPAVPPFFLPPDEYELDDPNELEVDGMAVADVNGDGLLDAIVACRGGPHKDRSSARVLVGTGDPAPGLAFQPADTWKTAQRRPWYVAIDDFNRDGKPDFFSSELGGVRNVVSVVLNSNCQARRLRLIQNVSRGCNMAGMPFSMQPVVQVEDDGANPLLCNADPVNVVEAGGTALFGTTPLGTTSGVADWSTALNPLYINDAGKKYRLQFTHLYAGLTRSWTFSVSPSLSVIGPDSYCAVSSGFFSTDPGFDTYRWYVSPPFLNPLSFTRNLTIGAGALVANSYVAQVDATVDSCLVPANKNFDVFDDLSSVSVAPTAKQTICTTCPGSTLTVTETGGGAVTRKWGYRATPGGAITYLPGQTGLTYDVHGSHFPGQGTYYVVVETTPQCGVVTVSDADEVEVEVTATTAADVVPLFTVRSTSQLNRLEWIYPPSLDTVAIRYNTSPTWSGCSPPANVSSGTALPDQTGPPGGKGGFDHGVLPPLFNDTTYCYSIFAQTSPGPPPVYSPNARSAKGRPFDTSGPVKWAYSTGATSMAPPGLGPGVIHAVSNDESLHSMVKGAAGGSWPPGWTPFVAMGPSQSRPSTVGISIPPAGNAVYLGSQAAAGNNSVAVDADTGMGLWGQPLGAPVQAGPGGIFSAYGGSMDAILLGTFDSGNPNAFHALDPFTGNPLPGWPYTGETVPLNEIGQVSAQAAVDYLGERVFFASYHYAAGTDSVWCVDLTTGSRCPLWPVQGTATLDHVYASPTLRGGVLYVAPINGEIHALDANDGSPRWAGPFLPGDGQVKLFVLPDFFSADLYFSTDSTVWAISDPGGGPPPPPPPGAKWQRPLPNPSQPVFYPGTGRVWVGGGDGQLYILDAATGLDAVAPIPLGDPDPGPPPPAMVGAPTVDQANGFVYVGTEAGVVYAVAIP